MEKQISRTIFQKLSNPFPDRLLAIFLMKVGGLHEGRRPTTTLVLGTLALLATTGQAETSNATTLSLAFGLPATESRDITELIPSLKLSIRAF